jgi:hypothetical protein
VLPVTGRVIEQAKGMIMDQSGCTAWQAFDVAAPGMAAQQRPSARASRPHRGQATPARA